MTNAAILPRLRQWRRLALAVTLAALIALSAIPMPARAQSNPPSARLNGVTH